jgi:NitT/TauT family transport system substrate-binding protein
VLACTPPLSLAAEATALQEIKIGYTSQSISAFPIEFARRKGFFRAEGLNVLMIVMRKNVIVTALVTRGIDYGTPATSVIRGAASDLPIKAVAVLTGRPDYFLAAKKEFKSLKDLKGKRIAIGTFGAAADIALRTVLRQEGLDPERPDNLVISDAAIKAVVDQAQTELNIKGPVLLDKVRDWSFAEKATKK